MLFHSFHYLLLLLRNELLISHKMVKKTSVQGREFKLSGICLKGTGAGRYREVITVEPSLTDPPPPEGGHKVQVPATYNHYIFRLSKAWVTSMWSQRCQACTEGPFPVSVPFYACNARLKGVRLRV